ncbi:MAG: hypothetical protein JXQ93_12740 [Flavobacteriaceae bacterium]
MILIKPSQISGEIMTLIEEADRKLIIVSPYCKFSDWKKFLNTIDFLKRKKTPVEFYVRKGEEKTIKEINEIGFTPIEVINLHTKLYINEKYAVVSSMNLLTYSDMNSLDIAYKTETEKEYNELLEYYNRYLKPFKGLNSSIKKRNSPIKNYADEIKSSSWDEYLSDLISKELDVNCKIKFDRSSILIKCGNIYEAYISNTKKGNTLNITGIISAKELELLKLEKSKFYKKSGLNILLKKGKDYEYDTAVHNSKTELKSSKLNYLYRDDYNKVIETIFDFIITLQDFKQYCRTIK